MRQQAKVLPNASSIEEKARPSQALSDSPAIEAFWESYLQKMRTQLSPEQFLTWLKPLVALSYQGGVLTITAPNSFKLEWARKNYVPSIQALAREFFRVAEVKVECVGMNKAVTHPAVSVEGEQAPLSDVPSAAPAIATKRPAESGNGYSFVSHFTFENFVPGKANQLAYAAAQHVANEIESAYNPLFICGSPGLGKTHLLHAIGQHIRQTQPHLRTCLVHGEEYVRHVVNAYQRKDFDTFKKEYHNLDVLLVDDVQFIAGKARTQEEFFFTYEALKNAGRRIILTSDTYPSRIEDMDLRLSSRLDSGLTVTIDAPEIEMRVAILLRKAVAQNLVLSESVAFFIAKHLRSNVRELEGALKNLLIYHQFNQDKEITIEVVKTILQERLVFGEKEIHISDIQKQVAELYRIKVADLLGKSRLASVTRPRQLAMYLAKELTNASLVEIGEAFNRDHTTVMHALRQVSLKRNTDKKMANELVLMEQGLRGD